MPGPAVEVPALDSDSLSVESKPLDQVPLKDIAKVLKAGLSENYKEAEVEVVECPDLTQEPWGLAAPGLCGNPRILDIGGVPYLVPLVTREKLYQMKDYPKLTGPSKGLVIGAGAAPWPFLGRNAEMMPNLLVKEDGNIVQETRISRTHDEDNSFSTQKLPCSETRNSLLGNLYISEGEGGQVLRVRAKARTGGKPLVTAMREALVEAFPDKSIGLGGVFNIISGKAKIHVMPDFSPCPLNSNEDVDNWLNFYEMSAPFTVLSVLVANDPGLDLRVEHSHGWGDDGKGGHYHIDTTPDEVEYLGYYGIANECYRVDRPVETHMVGRD